MEEYSEIDAIKAVNEALVRLQPEEQVRVLSWAYSKYAATGAIFQPGNFPDSFGKGASPEGNLKGQSGKRKTKRSKSTPKLLKDIDLHPKGKPSAADFANEKQPTNTMLKSVVAVYYFRDILGVEKVSTDHVYTYFKAVGWPVPADVPNTLQRAGTEGWLDTADSQAILITTTGENLIEHQLPATKSNK
ncbi:hypothetical protein [Mesorhizobium sp. B2-1-3A]|uniref:hypothetical protein n=1 Tax=Mesorhizobium sp. B2-1-3A TaxID=2589971 RepID=UPI00112D881F|nr:hypothetical protein [Mesorhizobium sp. B2-1-3A]TPM91621.1 hypothetical protein FJ977_32565 [Mesorhizobium sp. B2-1-3A]